MLTTAVDTNRNDIYIFSCFYIHFGTAEFVVRDGSCVVIKLCSQAEDSE